jgi:hypothetical protein
VGSSPTLATFVNFGFQFKIYNNHSASGSLYNGGFIFYRDGHDPVENSDLVGQGKRL